MDLVIIAVIAFFTSILSGLLGIGGAVLLIPAYHYLPPIFGATPISVPHISGMTSVQVLVSSIAGTIVHRNKGTVNRQLVLAMGIPITVTAFIGSLISGLIPPHIILYLFGAMALVGAALIVARQSHDETDIHAQFSRTTAIAIAAVVGLFGGIVGAAGGFLLAPLMMVFLKVPIRMTIGSTLGIVVVSALATSFGKFITGQVLPIETAVAVAASLPGVIAGSLASHRARPSALRLLLAVLIALIGISMFLHE
jgi:hypothetical protein